MGFQVTLNEEELELLKLAWMLGRSKVLADEDT
jgi:hypothetical protein